jgi:hypothetical protein
LEKGQHGKQNIHKKTLQAQPPEEKERTAGLLNSVAVCRAIGCNAMKLSAK